MAYTLQMGSTHSNTIKNELVRASAVKVFSASLVFTISLLCHFAYAGRELVPVDDRPDILSFDPRTHQTSAEFNAFEIKLQFQFVAEVYACAAN